MMNLFSSLTVAGFVCLAAVPAGALMMEMDVDTLTRESSDVITGTVQQTRSYWNDDHTMIFTDALVSVESSAKGPSGPDATMQVTILGGKVGTTFKVVSTQPTLMPEERVLLFLQGNPSAASSVRIVGNAQGKYRLIDDPQTGQTLAVSEGCGVMLKNGTIESGKKRQYILSDLLERIQQIATEEQPDETK